MFFSLTSKNEINKSIKNIMISLFPSPPEELHGNRNLNFVAHADKGEIMEIGYSKSESNDMNQMSTVITNEKILKK